MTKDIQSTRRYVAAFIESLRECGHSAENVMTVLMELVGVTTAAASERPLPPLPHAVDFSDVPHLAHVWGYTAEQMHTYVLADRAASERFFLDHDTWHDRVTGQHLYTEEQHRAELDSVTNEAWAAVEAAGVKRDGWVSLPEAIGRLAASAPQAVRMPLTEEQILRTPLDWTGDCDAKIAFAREIEAAHGIVPLAPQDGENAT